MSLKILVVPSMLVGTLVIAIGYVKPGIATVLEKKDQLSQTTGQVERLATIVNNIQSLKGQITTASDDVDFLKTYFPGQSDVEKEIDQLNFLASKSGVAVKDIQVTAMKKPVVADVLPQEDTESSSAAALFTGTETSVVALPVSTKKTYVPATYTVTVQSVGSYDAVKSFAANIMKAHRFLRIAESSITLPQSEGANATAQPAAGTLESEITVELPVLSPVKVTTALGDAAFDIPKINFETLATVRTNNDGAVPELPRADTGKSNLFQ